MALTPKGKKAKIPQRRLGCQFVKISSAYILYKIELIDASYLKILPF